MKREILSIGVLSLAVLGACKKGDGSGGGGGGGGWLVGPSGLMANITPGGTLGPGYDLGAQVDLAAIACRFPGEAFVVGAHGTVLYTEDGGQAWTSLATPDGTRDLRALATQDTGDVFVAGDGTLLRSTDAGDHWTELSDRGEDFRAVAAAQAGATVMAVDADGGVWRAAASGLARVATIAGAKAIAVSPNGAIVLVGGAGGLALSRDAGQTFAPVAGAAGDFASVRVDDTGAGIAAGAHGLVANLTAAGHVLAQHVGTSDFRVVHLQTWGDATANGYLAGDDGQVYLTSDAGWSWTPGPALGRAVTGADVIGAGHN